MAIEISNIYLHLCLVFLRCQFFPSFFFVINLSLLCLSIFARGRVVLESVDAIFGASRRSSTICVGWACWFFFFIFFRHNECKSTKNQAAVLLPFYENFLELSVTLLNPKKMHLKIVVQ